MTDRTPPSLPWPARLLDTAALVAAIVAASVAAFGGFREGTPIGRLSVTSWTRPFAVTLLLLVVRHVMWRTPSAWSRVAAGAARWRRHDDARSIAGIVIASRLGVLIAGFLGIALIGYAAGTPPYRVYNNDILDMPARWDTGWYMGIATSGYSFDPAAASTMQNIAFFPLYPMLMRFVGLLLGRNVIWAGVLVSIVSFALAARYLFLIARPRIDRDSSLAAIALLAAYPFALFFSATYTESLFLLGLVASCYYFERDRLLPAAAWGLAVGLTRPNGCFLSIVLALMVLRDIKTSPWAATLRRLSVAAMPGVGLLVFSAYIYGLTGNPLQWAAQHGAWGREYKGLWTLFIERLRYIQANGLYNYVSTLTVDLINLAGGTFAIVSVWPVWRRFGAPYAALVAINVLVPLLAGGTLSLGRITSILFPTFLWLGVAIPASHRSAWLIVFAMLQAVFAVVFFTWRPLY
jgi:hypothetical protein